MSAGQNSMKRELRITGLALLAVAALGSTAVTEEKFQKLTGGQIRAKLAGAKTNVPAAKSLTMTSSALSSAATRPRSSIGRSTVRNAFSSAAPNTPVVPSFAGSVLTMRNGVRILRATSGNAMTRAAIPGVGSKNSDASSGWLYAINRRIAVCVRRAPASAVNTHPPPNATSTTSASPRREACW